MNIIKGTCCPHYDEEPERRPTVKKLLTSMKARKIFAVDGGAALHIKNEKNFRSVIFKKHRSAYIVSFEKENLVEKSFKQIIL